MSVDPIYVDLATESDDPCVTQIESLCLSCHGKGTTRLLMTKIPHYREVILTSFECKTCGNRNTGVDLGSMQDFGVKYELTVVDDKDLSRQVVRSDKAQLKILELDLEIDPQGKEGEITTVEGIVLKVKDNLEQGQKERKTSNSDLAEQIQGFIGRLDDLLQLSQPFTLIVDDCTGNSHVESLLSPNIDSRLKKSSYKRTKEHNEMLGIFQENGEIDDKLNMIEEETHEDDLLNLQEDVLQFNTTCNSCYRPCVTKMKVTQIPHFKEVIIMATDCDSCGYKSNEVKSGGGISKKARKISLFITNRQDLSRDILKSETCSISVPELDLDVGCGILVGKFTTVEGILVDIKEDLRRNAFLFGDSAAHDTKNKMETLLDSLQEVIDGKLSIHLILDDSAGNSYVQNLKEPEVDPQLVVEEYTRTFEQNEELGLNDMKTENYAEDS